MTAPPPERSSASSLLGLYDVADFVVRDGRCADCAAIPQALWYFRDETIAVPRPGLPVAGFERGVTAREDVTKWAAAHPPGGAGDYPSLVWIGSPIDLRGARLAADGGRLETAAGVVPFTLVPKIPLNRSYYNDASVDFLARRTLNIRGRFNGDTFVARTIWPEDFRLDADAAAMPIAANADAIRELMRAEPHGGATSPFAATILWERTPGPARQWDGKPVLAAMVNGAQGDDDEAHGGHFALVTGRVGVHGAIDDWLANNFYTLDSYSEKGIIASVLPLDDYLADLNSGQAWYRPSYLLVAVLKRERIAAHVQSALNRVYNQLYRHQLVYEHATMNCASISVDVLRALGWNIPARGPTSRVVAAAGLPYFAVRDRSIAKAKQMYGYLTEDRTRLLPAAAFEEFGSELLRLTQGRATRPPTPFETMLVDDIDALIFLRVPQLPSSRASGDSPVVSAWEYMARLPKDQAKAQIVPVPPRPFPDAMRDSDLLAPRVRGADWAVMVWALITIVGIPWLLYGLGERWKRRGAPPSRAD